MPAILSPAELRSQLETVLKDRQPEVVALAISAEFPEETLECKGRTYLVRRARSVLEFHDHVDQAKGRPLLCLTELDSQELGLDLRCRLHKRRVLSVDPWETVRHLFDCRSIESSLIRQPHLATYLLTHQPPEGYSKVKGDVLTADKVWSCLFTYILGLPGDYLDSLSLLSWASGDCRAYLASHDDLKASARERVVSVCGDLGRALLDTIEDGRLHPWALGLALRALAAEHHPDKEQEKALLRLEQYTGNRPLEAKVIHDWVEAAEHLYRAETRPDPALLNSAEGILVSLQAESSAIHSVLLPKGLGLRLERLARTLAKSLESPEALESLESATSDCLQHHGLGQEDRRRLEMVPRLVRWLHSASPEGQKLSLPTLANRYAQNTAFAEWARLRSEGTPGHSSLAEPMCVLLTRVGQRLESTAELFAKALAAWNSAGEPGQSLWKVEQLIDHLLVPLASAKGGRFLLVVLDGCGWPTMHELLDTFPFAGWRLLEPEQPGGLPPMLATFPSVTEFSRTSLLSGRLGPGNSAKEKTSLRDHAGLRSACNQDHPPIVFHKADLDNGFGALATEVQKKIANPKVKAVAVIINAIDDHLDKDDQICHPWNVGGIRYLLDLVGLAHSSGRTLILTSDHGHVLERGAELRKSDNPGGARWRAGDSAGKGEIVLSGPRVMSPGGTVVLPWSESVRYTKKKNGYHGGCHPGEAITPLVVMAPAGQDRPGWVEAHMPKPIWWQGTPAAKPRLAPVGPVNAIETMEPISGQMLLVASEASAPPTDYAATVLSHPLIADNWKSQKSDPDSGWAQRLLNELEAQGGASTIAQLASIFGQPEPRFRELLIVAANLLAVDGCYIVSLTPDGGTVLLNKSIIDSGGPPSGVFIEVERANGELVRFSLPLKKLTKGERIILENLARYGQLSEAELSLRASTKRVSGMLEMLMEKLSKGGFGHLSQAGKGQGGRIYRLNVEAIERE